MHLNSPLAVVPARFVAEIGHVEITTQLAIDPLEQVEVERGGHSDGVVIRGEQLRHGLFQVGRKQKAITRSQLFANVAQKIFHHRALQVADGAAHE